MAQDKTSLEKLLLFINEIANTKGNEWFRTKLVALIDSSTEHNIGNYAEEAIKIIEDINRTRYYLKYIDRSYWSEGLKFYSAIKYPELKINLIGDYKEMKIAEMQNDIIEFTRRLVMQMENCVTVACSLLDAHSVIKSKPDNYIVGNSNLLVGDYSFFERDGSSKLLNKINLPSKLLFTKQYYKLIYSFNDASDMITIRNKSSHRGEFSEREQKIWDYALNNVLEKKAAYTNCFNSIIKNIKILYE